jgi:hypothetical protein
MVSSKSGSKSRTRGISTVHTHYSADDKILATYHAVTHDSLACNAYIDNKESSNIWYTNLKGILHKLGFKHTWENQGTLSASGLLTNLKGILHKLGFKHTWENQGTLSASGLLTALKQKLNNNYGLYCKDEAIKDDTKPHGGKLRVYNKIKCNFKMEMYLLLHGDRSTIQRIIRLQISALKLRIERGRYGKNPLLQSQRICVHCQKGEVEDEFHFAMSCSRYSGARAQLLTAIARLMPVFHQVTAIDQFHSLMRCDDTELMALFLPFISTITDIRNGGE